MKIVRAVSSLTLAVATAGLTTPVKAQDLDALKQRCDAYGFVRGSPEHADCVRKLDVEQVRDNIRHKGAR